MNHIVSIIELYKHYHFINTSMNKLNNHMGIILIIQIKNLHNNLFNIKSKIVIQDSY